MKRDEISSIYISLIVGLSQAWSGYFGNVWWYSLIHEKNTTISNAYHSYAKGLSVEKQSFVFLRMLWEAIKKYFVFVFRAIIFKGNARGAALEYLDIINSLFVTYGDGVIEDIIKEFQYEKEYEIIIPQKNDWKSLRTKMKKEYSKAIIDEFLPVYSFFVIPILYIWNVFKFLINRRFRHLFNSYAIGRTHRNDLWRSFVGDVLIEGLFFEYMFRSIAKRFEYIERVVYIYEGRAWEKALCNSNFNYRCIKIGLLCTAPALGILNFFYTPDELEIMPRPDYLGVVGKVPYEIMKGYYGSTSVFILGAMGYGKLKNWMDKKNRTYYDKKYITVILGSNDEQAKEILDFVNEGLNKQEFIVRPHPDSNINYTKMGFRMAVAESLEYYLRRTKFVIVYDSTVSLEALALGVPVVVPKLPSFADTNPLTGLINLKTDAVNPQDLRTYLEEGIVLRKSDARRFVNDYFSFTTPKDMKKRLISLNRTRDAR